MDWFWWLIIGIFLGGFSVMILMSMLTAASQADDINLGVKQYEEN